MDKDLVIEVTPSKVSIALLEEGRLVEYNEEQSGDNFSIGNVFLGKVKRVMPALNAAFVDIGAKKDAFIHYSDLGHSYKSFDYFLRHINQNRKKLKSFYNSVRITGQLDKDGKIEGFLKPGQNILVSIEKEPISTKGSRLSGEISIAGRNIVLLPFSDKVNISSKISDKSERNRLERLVYSILPPNYGVIIRTVAQGKKAAVLDAELKSHIEKWESSWSRLVNAHPPKLLFTESDRSTIIVRDRLNDSFTNIVTNDASMGEALRDYVAEIAPEKEKIVKIHKGSESLFDHLGITKQLKGAFGKVIPLKHGAYLIIEHTEALTAIDVNSGIRAKNGVEQEENVFEVNMIAAEEIARQLRLRDIGGIIVIDFIDMHSAENRAALHKKMFGFMERDRARHKILPLTRFGLMEITRERVRPATMINTNEKCPSCNGTGQVSSTAAIDETIERELAYFVENKGYKKLYLQVNPIIKSYLTKGVFTIVRGWNRKYNSSLKVIASNDNAFLEMVWLDEKMEKIS